MRSEQKYRVVGMMSGTSLDGIDLVLCQFRFKNDDWKYEVLKTETVVYPAKWREKLQEANKLEISGLNGFDREYGIYIGRCIRDFIVDESIDLIGSHGHTIFHRPAEGITRQIGCGKSIVEETGITVVNDFRSLDVELGGQGAPLVPIGDELLFSDYDYCLNLGGFSNISFKMKGKRIAWDICPVNIVLNKLNPPFDKNGERGSKGKVCIPLFEKLNDLPYFHMPPPKSLGREWVEDEFESILGQFELTVEDKLRTVYEHIAFQIRKAVLKKGRVLVTGGGTWNSFLIRLLKEMSDSEYIIPDAMIVNYKEALIFALLAVLRVRNEINCLASVTGASRDSCCGVIHQSMQPLIFE